MATAPKEPQKPATGPKVKTDTRGRRPEYSDYREFRKKVDEYFVQCEEDGVFPDEKGMFIHLNIFEEDLDALIDPENEYANEYLRILKLARYRRESWLSRNMVRDNKMANGCMNALKQEQNGGYTDRPAAGKQQKVQIILPNGKDMKDLFS
jgi:hypothetical protein